MKKFLIIILGCIFVLQACKNPNQKEIGEVDALIKIIDNLETDLVAIDTTDLHSVVRWGKSDLERIRSSKRIMKKQTAFKIDDYIGRRKTLFALDKSYEKYQKELLEARNQLNNLKQDLENGLIKKEDFIKYYETEQKAVLMMNDKMGVSIRGMSKRINTMVDGRAEFLKMLEDSASYSSIN